MSSRVDKELVRERFSRCLGTYGANATVQRETSRRLVSRLVAHGGVRHDRILEIGCGTGLLTEVLSQRLEFREITLNDLVPDCDPIARSVCRPEHQGRIRFLSGDIENGVSIPAGLDLIVSNAVFQWVNSPDGLLERVRSALKPEGLLAFCTFGPDNLREVRALTGESLSYASRQDLKTLMDRHFRVLECEESTVEVVFSSPLEVLRHLKATGTNALSRRSFTRGSLVDFDRSYRSRFGKGDRVPLTYHPLILIGRR